MSLPHQRLRRARIQAQLLRLADEVPRREVPFLALPLVHVRLDHVAVGAFEGGIDVQHRLHPVLAGRDLARALERPAARLGVDHRRLSRLPAVHVDPEQRLRAQAAPDLEARLALVGLGDDQQHAPVERALRERSGVADLEAKAGGRLRPRRKGDY